MRAANIAAAEMTVRRRHWTSHGFFKGAPSEKGSLEKIPHVKRTKAECRNYIYNDRNVAIESWSTTVFVLGILAY